MKRNYISPSVDTMLCPEAGILAGSAPTTPPATPGIISTNPNPQDNTGGDAPRRVRVF